MAVLQIQGERFQSYPPQAREIATRNLALLQQLPLAFLPLLLRELIVYDWKFPAERDEIDRQFRYLEGLDSARLSSTMRSFADLKLSSDLEAMDWIGNPARFSERLSAYLWATHQIDDFSKAAEDYIRGFNIAVPEATIPAPRLGIAVIGREITQTNYPLFRKLRPHGVYFSQVDAGSDYQLLLDTIAARTKADPIPYAHWRIEGGQTARAENSPLTSVAYGSLEPLRRRLIQKMQQISASNAGVEALRTRLAETEPSEVGMRPGDDPVLSRFAISVLSEGSGTQIYSTTFVQWTAREALRRARPLTILARFAPRQTEESADGELSGLQKQAVLDPAGSLLDADMGAYYTWVNLQRLSGASQSRFLAWFEGHGAAVAIGPSCAPGTESHEQVNLSQILHRMQSAS
ncbi:MAG: hypothetical protein WA510_02260 [Acidobacteriaceae bacterium]